VVSRGVTWYHRSVTQLRIRAVDDEAGLQQWCAVNSAAFAADFDALPGDRFEEVRPALSGPLGGDDIRFLVGVDGSDPVVGVVAWFGLHDNLHLASVRICVHPEHRRRGFGRAGVAAALDLVRSTGRPTVLAEIPTRTRVSDPSPGNGLAESLGFESKLVETRRMLDLRELAAARVQELRADSERAAQGYSLLTWTDRAPEAHQADLAALHAGMSTDAPQGDLPVEPESWDVARFVEWEDGIVSRSIRQLVVAVRHDDSGQVVGYSAIGIPPGETDVAFQWDTIVRRDHRGHRLGMLLKTANLQELARDQPQIRYVNTWNADDNTHMIAVNETLGFRPMEGWGEWQLDL
jgi:GNAT superfamily N-acetyltransferase